MTAVTTDAPTTLPTDAGPQMNRLGLVERAGGIVVSPLRALAGLARSGDAHPLEPALIYAVVVLAVHAAETYRLLALVGDAPLIVLRRLFDLVLRAGRTDLVVVAVAAVLIGAIAKARGQKAIGAAVAVTYLLIPLALLKALGGLLALAGVEVWALPHRAVDSLVVVVDNQVDWGRFTVKCVVAYTHGLVVLLWWLATMTTFRQAPRAVTGRCGAAIVIAIVGLLVLMSVGNVLNRADALRPRTGGDMFPALSLPKLFGKARLDIATLVGDGDGKAKVLVVDFWASWCAPCKRSLPELKDIAARYQERGVVVVGVNREPMNVPAARDVWQALKPGFDSVIDNAGLGERLGLTSLPSSYVVDRTGRIRHLHLGYTEPAVLERELDALLAEDGGATSPAP